MAHARSAQLERHWERLRTLGCIVCRGYGPHIHHAGGGSMKSVGVHKAKGLKNSDWLVLPLCENHHTGFEGIHTGVETWESSNDTQVNYLNRICQITGTNVWREAAASTPASKILPRIQPSG